MTSIHATAAEGAARALAYCLPLTETAAGAASSRTEAFCAMTAALQGGATRTAR